MSTFRSVTACSTSYIFREMSSLIFKAATSFCNLLICKVLSFPGEVSFWSFCFLLVESAPGSPSIINISLEDSITIVYKQSSDLKHLKSDVPSHVCIILTLPKRPAKSSCFGKALFLFFVSNNIIVLLTLLHSSLLPCRLCLSPLRTCSQKTPSNIMTNSLTGSPLKKPIQRFF